jgi:hypothetical protein
MKMILSSELGDLQGGHAPLFDRVILSSDLGDLQGGRAHLFNRVGGEL